MNAEQYIKNLSSPNRAVDVILDTDAYNEIDDQFAIAYMLRCSDRLRVKGICAAPFLNKLVSSAEEGMLKSRQEILNILTLAQCPELSKKVYSGSRQFMDDEQTPVPSDAAAFMAKAAEGYSPENPLYIVAIGAITNVASALMMNPAMKEKTVIVWLGGHALHEEKAAMEFNMRQDIAAARVVMNSGVPLVLLPCRGVVDRFATTGPELDYWLWGKNALCDYLVTYTVETAESYAKGKPWSRPIWDVTAIAWLLNDKDRFMNSRLCPCPIPEYSGEYTQDPVRHQICYVHRINRDELFAHLFQKLGDTE